MSLGIGVIGAGIMGSDHAATLARSVKGAAVVAVSDPDVSRAAAVASAAGAAIVHADAIDLIAEAGVEAVLIASPDATHEAFVLACLDAGKPVLCEKPLAPDVAGCLRIVAAETTLGRRLVQVGFMRRFDPGYVEMRDVLRSGRLGEPLMIHCVHRNAAAPPSFDATAVIVNSAVHELDIVRWLVDDEFATATVFGGGHDADDGSVGPQFLVLETRRGIVAGIEAYVNAGYGYDVRAEVVCRSGTLTLSPRPPVSLRSAGSQSSAFAADWRLHFADAYWHELQAWIDSVAAGEPAGASAWDGYVATATAAACLASLATGGKAAVALEPRPPLYDRAAPQGETKTAP